MIDFLLFPLKVFVNVCSRCLFFVCFVRSLIICVIPVAVFSTVWLIFAGLRLVFPLGLDNFDDGLPFQLEKALKKVS